MNEAIYNLYTLTKRGIIFYVGISRNPTGRLIDHRVVFGKNIKMDIIETGLSKPEAVIKEAKYIYDLRQQGVVLKNKHMPLYKIKNQIEIKDYSQEIFMALDGRPQKWLCDRAKITQTNLCNKLAGIALFKPEELSRIDKVLGTSLLTPQNPNP